MKKKLGKMTTIETQKQSENQEITTQSLKEIIDLKIKDAKFDIKFYKEKWYQAEYMLKIYNEEKKKLDLLND